MKIRYKKSDKVDDEEGTEIFRREEWTTAESSIRQKTMVETT